MKGFKVILFAAAMLTVTVVNSSKAAGVQGALLGNPEGTKFCCAPGTNGCYAAKCGSTIE